MLNYLFPPIVGASGEAFVEFHLLRQGIRVHKTSAGTGYDLVADVDGRLVRVEVKTTAEPRMKKRCLTYDFSLAKGNALKYDGVEIFAFVALDIPQVIYVSSAKMGRHGSRKEFPLSAFLAEGTSFRECAGNVSAPPAVSVVGEEIEAMNILTREIFHYPDVKSAVEDGFSASGISSCLCGRLRTHKGHSFRMAV